MKVKFTILIIIWLLAIDAKSQLALIGEYNQLYTNVDGLNNFTSSFNDFWGNRLSEPYESYQSGDFTMPNFGIGGRISAANMLGFTMSLNMLYGKSQHSKTVTWSNNIQNELEHNLRDFRFNFSGGFILLKTIFLEGYLGSTFRKMGLNHYTIYPDGSKSLSQLYELNGQYSGTTVAFDYGVQAGIRVWRLYVYGRYTFPTKNFPPAKGLVTMSDDPRIGSVGTQFPQDYALYATDPAALAQKEVDTNDAYIKTDDYEGNRFSIGVEFWIGKMRGLKEKL